jgi:hypothetical protein
MDGGEVDAIDRHRRHADGVRTAVAGPAGTTEAALRTAVLARSSGGPAIPEPYDELARQIGEAADRVTDAQVSAVRAATGTDKAAFEIVMTASIGAGLARWDAAIRVIEEVSDAPA